MRRGVYWHMLPEAKQGRKVVWDGIDIQGRRIIEQVFPWELRARTNSVDMKIELKCGSLWQVVGSDNYNSLVGANPVGIVFSEFSVAKPSAWDFLRPILRENGGWAIFIYTPRGRNHGYDLYQTAQAAGWFCETLTVDDTGIVSPEAIEEERRTGMRAEMIEQEYFCSFDSANVGSYYGEWLGKLRAEGRHTDVPYDAAHEVHTAWDLGYADDTAIWFFQIVGKEIHIIDYYCASGKGIEHYVEILSDKPYKYAKIHWLPHDAKAQQLAANGKTIQQQLFSLGIHTAIVPQVSLQNGIEAARATLPRCWFDKTRCKDGFEALQLYRREWDDDRKVFKDTPYHDWTSHAADAFRYLSLVWEEARVKEEPPPPKFPVQRTFNEMRDAVAKRRRD